MLETSTTAGRLYDPALLDHGVAPHRDAARIKEMRINAGLTQEELAVKLEVASETVSRWETRRWSLPTTVLLAVHHVLVCGGLCASAIATTS
jgi:DNA-binding transcriptional regulator YiaG